MSRLKVVLRGTLVSEIELSPEKEYIGGRKEGCDIRLQPEKGISREHFKLRFSDGKWQIVAISRFGDVFSLGQKIEQIDLQHGQSFHVPPYDFTFLELPESGVGEGAAKIPLAVSENTRTILGVAPQVPYIKITDAKGEIREMLRLEVGDVWVAGRDPACQIIIPDQRVSRRQFEIHKVNGAYTIIDLASVNGTFLNGSPVSSTDPQALKSGDAISVLDNIMYFELHDPNFKYKVENIEIPPIQVEPDIRPEPILFPTDAPISSGDTEVIEKTSQTQLTTTSTSTQQTTETTSDEVEEVEEYNVPQQIQAGDSPFTGMPNQQQFDPNQMYGLNQQPGMGGPIPPGGVPFPQPPPPPPKKGFLQNKVLLVTATLAFLGLAYWVSENMGETEPEKKPEVVATDPFSKLPPEKQKEVQELYSLAEQMYNQGKYDLALEKINKLKEILPTGYKDSEKMALEAEQANLTIVQAQKDAEALKEKQEREAKIKQIFVSCQKLLNPNITAAEMSQCLAEVAASGDPNDPEYIRLMGEAERLEKEKQEKELQAREREKQVAEMQTLFADAEKVQSQGYAFKAIKKYKLVLESSLPDPKKLKEKASERIEFIQSKIKEKSETNLLTADTYFKQGKIKEAVLTLREAIVYDPENLEMKDKIEAYSFELTRQVRALYQEAIIEENYGQIENTDSKQGAKEKWKKITDMDLEDGEYYRKAVMKLRRYGVM